MWCWRHHPTRNPYRAPNPLPDHHLHPSLSRLSIPPVASAAHATVRYLLITFHADDVEEESRMFPFTLSLLLALPQAEPRLDNFGDPLPPGAVARLGTLRYRCPVNFRLLGFTSTGNAIVFAGRLELKFLDVATGKTTTHSLAKLLNAKTAGTHLTYYSSLSGSGTTLLLPTSDHWLLVMDVATGKVTRELAVGDYLPLPTGNSYPAASFRLTYDAKTLEILDFSQEGSYRLRWIDVATGAILRETPWQKGHGRFECESPRPEHVAIRSQNLKGPDWAVDVWNIASARRVLQKTLPNNCHLLGLGPDGKTAILHREDQSDCVMVDLETDKQHCRCSASPPFASALSQDGKQVFISTDEALEQWDLATTKRLRSFPHPGRSEWWNHVIVSPDRRHVAMKIGDIVSIYDLAEGKPLHHDGGHGGAVGALAWSPSGKELLTVAADDRARWWDAGRAITLRTDSPPESNPQKRNAAVYRGDVRMLAYVFPDGKQVAASWSPWPLMAWDTASKDNVRPVLEESSRGAVISPRKALLA
jgi:WD40 repeat protein